MNDCRIGQIAEPLKSKFTIAFAYPFSRLNLSNVSVVLIIQIMQANRKEKNGNMAWNCRTNCRQRGAEFNAIENESIEH